MRIYSEDGLINFNFWSGASDTVNYLTHDELNTIEGMLEELHEDGMSDTEVNDFFWFETETIADWLGYDSFDDIINRD
ncbi:MAG: hypothetical protein ABS939_15315 [Psychrobacillus sp.]